MKSFKQFYSESTKQPKSDCFGNVRAVASKLKYENVEVVHGKVKTKEGKVIDHAWIEIENKYVIDPTYGNEKILARKEQYYSLLHAVPEAKYTPEQADINMVRSGNLGPWTKEEVGNRFIWRNDANI